MEVLPDHILVQCLAWLPPQHQVTASLVCRRFRDLLVYGRVLRYSLCQGRLEPWLCVMGGVQKGHRVAEMYNPREQRWRPLPSPSPSSCFNFSCVDVNEKLYIVGGFVGLSNTASPMQLYDKKHNRWEKAAQMIEPREAFACGVIKGCIYIAGGLCRQYDTDNTRVRSAEVYVPEEDKWHSIPAMNDRRSCCASAVVDDKLYVIGGYSTPLILASVEVFDPLIGEWGSRSEMLDPWIVVGCAAIGPLIYLVGSKFTDMDKLELQVYDTGKDNWQDKGVIPVSVLLHDSSLWGSAVVSMNGYLYVVGGASYHDGGGLSSALVYDPQKDQWTSLPQMHSPRHGCAGTVIYL